jgi:hypothetical protein
MGRNIRLLVVAAALSLMAGCGGGGGSSGPTTPISGSVNAPGGVYALGYNQSMFARIFNALFASATAAAPTSFAPVGANVLVRLVTVDASGNPVGAPLATGTTAANGSFTIQAPGTIVPSSNLMLQVLDAGGNVVMSAMVPSVDRNAIDPVSSAATALVQSSSQSQGVSVNSLNVLSWSSLVAALNAQLASPVYTGSNAINIAGTVTAVQSMATQSEELSNQVGSMTSDGVAAGVVRDASGNPVKGVTIAIADFGNWVIRATTLTDASGAYVINAPRNKPYIIGAFTKNMGSRLASQWWTAGGGAINAFSADQLTLGAAPAVRNFTLSNGVLVSGTLTGASAGLAGIEVKFWDFYSSEYNAKVTSASDGTFSIGMPYGKYVVSAANATVQPWASGWYAGEGVVPTLTSTTGSGVTLDSSNATRALNFSLQPGYLLTGSVRDNAGGVVTGQVIRVFDGNPDSSTFNGLVTSTRTDLTGKYYAVLAKLSDTAPSAATPSNLPFYTVRVRGQARSVAFDSVTRSALPPATDFTGQVQVIRGFVVDANGNPVPQAKIQVYTYGGSASTGASVAAADATVTSVTYPIGLPGVAPADTRYAVAASSNVGFDCVSNNTQSHLNEFSPCYTGLEVSNADGSFEVYAGFNSPAQRVVILAKLDNASATGSSFYRQGGGVATRLIDATQVAISTGSSPITLPQAITLPATGFTLNGTLTMPDGTPAAGYVLSFRAVGAETFACAAGGNVVTGASTGCGYYAHGYTGVATRADGTYSVNLVPGSYYVRLSSAQSPYFSAVWKYAWLTASPLGNLAVKTVPACANCAFDWSAATGTVTLNYTVPVGM